MRLSDVVFDGVRVLFGFAGAFAVLVLALGLYDARQFSVGFENLIRPPLYIVPGAALVFGGGYWAGRLRDRREALGWAALMMPIVGGLLCLTGAFLVSTWSSVAYG